MASKTGITWTDSTQNFWWGCTEVSEGCDNCYAKTLSTRFGHDIWGPKKMRRTFKDSHWNAPYDWNRSAEKNRVRRKIFTNSMADFFDAEVPQEWRDRAWKIIKETTWLDWQILTKRHARIKECLPRDWDNGYPNVWLGVSAENQHWYDVRMSYLADIPAVIRWVSAEPLLGRLDINEFGDAIDWIVVGGESGNNARPMHKDWVLSIRDGCKANAIAFFFKQWGDASPARDNVHHGGDLLDGMQYHEFPNLNE